MIITVTPNPVLDRTLTVPEIVLDEVTRAVGTREDWGGKGFNVSRALRALGKESVAIGFIGGPTGEKLKKGLASLGIATDLIPIAGETRMNIVITDTPARHYVKVNEAGPTIRSEEVAALLDNATKRAKAGDFWALCGSLPPGVPPDFYADLISRLQSRGAKALLDTSGEPLRLGIAARPYAVKPNLQEAAAWLGKAASFPQDVAQAVDNLLELGITLVALSLGADGLMLASPSWRRWARPPEVVARNPTGAGDALVAGLLYGLSERMSLDEVARWGVAAGTAAAAREGVSVGTREEVVSLRAQVQFVPWPAE